MIYEEALEYLASLATFGSQLGLTRIIKLLELMDNPQQKYKTIHVTGTNGKGSTSAMIAAILTASGISTALYTSPHLERYTERMKLNSHEASRQDFADAIHHTAGFVNEMVQQGFDHPTEFEVLTAAAFDLFARKKVEYAVIEVGLGGLLDSTNVIIPEVSVITNVTLEHTDRCGDTVEKIAVHKAGIIKPGRPVITAAEGKALAVIRQKAVEQKSPLTVYGQDFSSKITNYNIYGQNIHFSNLETSRTVHLPLLGYHQSMNAALAIAVTHYLSKRDTRITEFSLQQGLDDTIWPGRFEIRDTKPMVIFDGAHNPAGIKVLRRTLNEYFPSRSVVFVLGVLRDKAILEMVTSLITVQDQVVVTIPLSDRACSASNLAQIIQQPGANIPVEIQPDIGQALNMAQRLAGPDGIVCVTGSLYLIGAARRCCQ